jgi:hypothetical protein
MISQRDFGRTAGPAIDMPMPILDEITQPDPAGMEEVLNRDDHHTLDAKDHDGSMSLSFSTYSARVLGWLMSAPPHKRPTGAGQERCVRADARDSQTLLLLPMMPLPR